MKKGKTFKGMGFNSLYLRAGQREHNVHRKAAQGGISFPAEPSYVELPLCVDTNSGRVAIESWPILLPADLEIWTNIQSLVQLFV